MTVVIAIENAFVRLDIQDTLRDLGVDNVRAVSTAIQAIAALEKEPCDAAILGLEGANPECQHLVDVLERLRIPIVIVASGVDLLETLPRLAHADNLSVPFDSLSLADALDRALRSGLTRPDAS
jgi:CheY-like chemotaxis protein